MDKTINVLLLLLALLLQNACTIVRQQAMSVATDSHSTWGQLIWTYQDTVRTCPDCTSMEEYCKSQYFPTEVDSFIVNDLTYCMAVEWVGFGFITPIIRIFKEVEGGYKEICFTHFGVKVKQVKAKVNYMNRCIDFEAEPGEVFGHLPFSLLMEKYELYKKEIGGHTNSE